MKTHQRKNWTRVLRRWWQSGDGDGNAQQSDISLQRGTRSPKSWHPKVRRLEPRIVLNATAELAMLGELAVTGDGADDFVRVEETASGEIQLFDGNNDVISIRTGEDAMGNPTFVDSIAVAAIPAGRLTVDLGDGDDSLDLQVIDNLDITVIDGDGQDSIDLSFGDGDTPNTIEIESETIRLQGGIQDASGDSIALTGNVQTSAMNTALNIGSGDLTIDGELQLGGDLNIDLVASGAASGSLDLDQAIVSSQATPASLVVDAGGQSIINLGEFNDNANSNIDDLIIRNAGEINLLNNDVNIDGALEIASAIETNIATTVSAGEIDITSEQLQIGQADLTTTDGNLLIDTPDDLHIGRLDAGDAIVDVTASSINDAQAADASTPDIIASDIRLQADSGIGNAAELELGEAEVIVARSAAGVIGLSILATTSDPVVLSDVRTGSGDIRISQTGNSSLQADSVVADDGDIQLTSEVDLLIGTVTANSEGDITLTAGDDVLSSTQNGLSLVTADDLIIRAGNAIDDGPTSVSLNTQVNDLDAVVSGPLRGDLEISEQDSVRLASSDQASDASTIATSNGEIRISATDTITVVDPNLGNDAGDLALDPEIIAGGDNGRMNLMAGQQFVAEDGVQISASQSTASAVVIDSPAVFLGEAFQITTDDGVGIARLFSPRPAPMEVRLQDVPVDPVTGEPLFDLPETAFYDYESIRTSILSQFNQNDAEGVFSVDIGTEGENGLTLLIDWGAQSNRFERLDDLAGDRTTVDVSHVYTQDDILNSTLNGRRSATDPLAVRFAVQHHDSIVLTGNEITQAGSFAPDGLGFPTTITEGVPGGLISSTDNPETGSNAIPDFENGRAFFVIPRIDVPVAFFPVRDVIPEPVDLPPPIQLTSIITLNDASVTVVEAASSSITIREEIFQIRMLSPDPTGEDLIEPVRLPSEILSGDRLETFLSRLPDGKYEIQYVLGDGDERSILRVDVRDGKSVTLDDALEAGTLKLTPLELDEAGNFDETIDRVESREAKDADQVDSSETADEKEKSVKEGQSR